MKAREKLHGKVKRDTINLELRTIYKKKKNYKKRVNQLIKTKKAEHFKDRFKNCHGDLSTTWKIVHEMIPATNSNISIHDYKGKKEKGEEFNEYFANVGRLAFENSQLTVNANNNLPTLDTLYLKVSLITFSGPNPLT